MFLAQILFNSFFIDVKTEFHQKSKLKRGAGLPVEFVKLIKTSRFSK